MGMKREDYVDVLNVKWKVDDDVIVTIGGKFACICVIFTMESWHHRIGIYIRKNLTS